MQNFNHLYYFYIVAKLKSVTSAALFLNTSQPSLSTQIKTLESNLKKVLFIKKGRFLELTAEGTKVYNYCSKMFNVYEELELYLKDENRTEEIKIGFSNEISRPFIADLISESLKKYKPSQRPKVKMVCVSHDALIDQLKTKKIDFALTNTETRDYELQTVEEFNMPVVLAGTADLLKGLDLQTEVGKKDFFKKIAAHLALPSEHLKLRIETNAFLAFNELNYQSLIESDNLSTMIRLTLEGLTFCLVPKLYIHKELKNNELTNLTEKEPLWKHNLFLLNRIGSRQNQFIDQMVSEIQWLN